MKAAGTAFSSTKHHERNARSTDSGPEITGCGKNANDNLPRECLLCEKRGRLPTCLGHFWFLYYFQPEALLTCTLGQHGNISKTMLSDTE